MLPLNFYSLGIFPKQGSSESRACGLRLKGPKFKSPPRSRSNEMHFKNIHIIGCVCLWLEATVRGPIAEQYKEVINYLPRCSYHLLYSAKRFGWKENWRQQDLNPQPSYLIRDELYHRTTVSCNNSISLHLVCEEREHC